MCDAGYSERDVFYDFYKLCFPIRWLVHFQTELCRNFGRIFGLRKFLFIRLFYLYIHNNFKQMMIINSVLRILGSCDKEDIDVSLHKKVIFKI